MSDANFDLKKFLTESIQDREKDRYEVTTEAFDLRKAAEKVRQAAGKVRKAGGKAWEKSGGAQHRQLVNIAASADIDLKTLKNIYIDAGIDLNKDGKIEDLTPDKLSQYRKAYDNCGPGKKWDAARERCIDPKSQAEKKPGSSFLRKAFSGFDSVSGEKQAYYDAGTSDLSIRKALMDSCCTYEEFYKRYNDGQTPAKIKCSPNDPGPKMPEGHEREGTFQGWDGGRRGCGDKIADKKAGEERAIRTDECKKLLAALQQKLNSQGVPKHLVRIVVRYVAAQLACNDCQLTEGTARQIKQILTEVEKKKAKSPTYTYSYPGGYEKFAELMRNHTAFKGKAGKPPKTFIDTDDYEKTLNKFGIKDVTESGLEKHFDDLVNFLGPFRGEAFYKDDEKKAQREREKAQKELGEETNLEKVFSKGGLGYGVDRKEFLNAWNRLDSKNGARIIIDSLTGNHKKIKAVAAEIISKAKRKAIKTMKGQRCVDPLVWDKEKGKCVDPGEPGIGPGTVGPGGGEPGGGPETPVDNDSDPGKTPGKTPGTDNDNDKSRRKTREKDGFIEVYKRYERKMKNRRNKSSTKGLTPEEMAIAALVGAGAIGATAVAAATATAVATAAATALGLKKLLQSLLKEGAKAPDIKAVEDYLQNPDIPKDVKDLQEELEDPDAPAEIKALGRFLKGKGRPEDEEELTKLLDPDAPDDEKERLKDLLDGDSEEEPGETPEDETPETETPEEKPKEKIGLKDPPKEWKYCGTVEEWKALPRKAKLEFLKRVYDAPDDTEEKALLMQEFDPKGSSEEQILAAVKDFCRKMKKAKEQKKKEAKPEDDSATDEGCEPGFIKISGIIKGLAKTSSDPTKSYKDAPLDPKIQKTIMRQTNALLQPYMKKYGLRFNEHQLKKVSNKLLQELQRRSLKEMKINNQSNMDISEIEEKLKSFIPHAQKYMGYPDQPDLTFVSDPENGKNILGKTAYYNPGTKEVTIYVDGRHPKDMMRSISHELVHHRQNCDGEFDRDDLDVGEGYAQRDGHLKEMERQAYEEGNMCFREWEDNYKAENPLQERNERLYHKLLRRFV